MRRRTLLTATAVAGPAALLTSLDEALAATLAPTGTGFLDTRLAAARALFDAGAHRRLLSELPGLLADAHVAARSRTSLDQARTSATRTAVDVSASRCQGGTARTRRRPATGAGRLGEVWVKLLDQAGFTDIGVEVWPATSDGPRTAATLLVGARRTE